MLSKYPCNQLKWQINQGDSYRFTPGELAAMRREQNAQDSIGTRRGHPSFRKQSSGRPFPRSGPEPKSPRIIHPNAYGKTK